MKLVHKILFYALCPMLLLHAPAFGQDEEPKLTLNGYLKNMFSLNDVGDSVLVDNLIHNRLNLRWYPHQNWNVYGALRTRLFTGETTKAIPDFVGFVEYDTYFFDLSWAIYENESVLLHTIIDRLMVEWNTGNWSVRAGRQRINWGITTVWNPNDIFNAYSYFDFDYEERPGTDAMRVEYFIGTNSSIDIAASLPGESTVQFDTLVLSEVNTFTAAAMFKTNKWNYDFQVLSGYSRENWVFGLGWAGNLKSASLKGEMTYFLPSEEMAQDPRAFVGTIGIDHSIKKFNYNLTYLLNTAGEVELGSGGLIALNSRALSAKNLSPYRHSAFVNGSYQVHPLLNLGMGFMFFPPNKAFFFSPFLTWNFLQNFDFDFIMQGFYGEQFLTGEFGSLSNTYFFRVKWSF